MSLTVAKGEFGTSTITTAGDALEVNIPAGVQDIQLWATDGVGNAVPMKAYHSGTDGDPISASAPTYPAGVAVFPVADAGGQILSQLFVAVPNVANGVINYYASKVGGYQ